jgi:uncharacterized lipoprotein YddW (UPF0748 family)
LILGLRSLFLLLFPCYLAAAPIQGVWVSPDWLLHGDRTYTDREVRDIVARTVSAVRQLGANTIFLETLLRGQSIAPCSGPGGTLPVYPLCKWNYAVEGTKVHDLLTMFIDEGRRRGVGIHAWVHAFYWRSDNESFRRQGQDGATLYDDLMAAYLDRVAKVTRSLPRRRAATELAAAMRQGFNWANWNRLMKKFYIDHFEGTLNNFIRFIESVDGPVPDFLVTNPKGELHGGLDQDRILAIYLNPQHPGVAQRFVWAVSKIVQTHPGLAGVHLDHIRYPARPFGPPGMFDKFPAAMRSTYYSPEHWQLPEFGNIVAAREAAITNIVQQVRYYTPPGMLLSAAVYPTYYKYRGNRNGTVVNEEYLSQDWAKWPINFAVPMIYNASASHVDSVLSQCRSQAAARAGHSLNVYPGISSRGLAHNYGRGRSWLLFDFAGLGDLLPNVPGSAMASMGLKDHLF